MKADAKTSFGRLRSSVGVMVAVVVLLFPSSASVICIAPNGSASIQDINAACHRHTHSIDPIQREIPSENGIVAAEDGRDCTDIFLTPNGNGSVSAFFDILTPSLSSHPALANLMAPNVLLSLLPPLTAAAYLSVIEKNTSTPVPASSPAPMRC